MKKYNNTILRLSMLAFCASVMIACGDEKEYFPNTKPSSGVHLKIMHAAYDGLEYQTTPPPGVAVTRSIRTAQFFVNTAKVTGLSIGYGGSFPPNDYLVLDAASDVAALAPFTAALIPTPELPEKQILNASTLNLSGDGYYTVAVAGPEANREVHIYEDDITSIPNDQKAYIRLIHLLSNNPNGIHLVGVRPVPAGSPPGTLGAPITLFENVTYGQATDFIMLPDVGTYTNIQVKDAVLGTVIVSLSAANSIANANRIYTVVVRGQQGITTTSDPKRPLFERTINR